MRPHTNAHTQSKHCRSQTQTHACRRAHTHSNTGRRMHTLTLTNLGKKNLCELGTPMSSPTQISTNTYAKTHTHTTAHTNADRRRQTRTQTCAPICRQVRTHAHIRTLTQTKYAHAYVRTRVHADAHAQIGAHTHSARWARPLQSEEKGGPKIPKTNTLVAVPLDFFTKSRRSGGKKRATSWGGKTAG